MCAACSLAMSWKPQAMQLVSNTLSSSFSWQFIRFAPCAFHFNRKMQICRGTACRAAAATGRPTQQRRPLKLPLQPLGVWSPPSLPNIAIVLSCTYGFCCCMTDWGGDLMFIVLSAAPVRWMWLLNWHPSSSKQTWVPPSLPGECSNPVKLCIQAAGGGRIEDVGGGGSSVYLKSV